ncbi:MAG: sodium:alanine symporter family protein [Bryobacterales bacterium]|nr:sodium:alanine symporter family protein [Bryobacterales bacterium]
MNWLLDLNDSVNAIVWGPPMMVVLLGTGVILTIATKGVQFRRFGFAARQVLGRHRPVAGEGTVRPFQALATSLSATVGVGNIVGVSIAVASGGPGAVLWMFLTGLVGMSTKFAEIAIALEYREKDDAGIMHGGAMYVLEKRYKLAWLGAIFAGFCALAAFGIGNMAQSNTIATAMQATYGIAEWKSGLVLAVLSGLVVLGGIRRIAEVASVLVPLMCGLYVVAALYILLSNWSALPGVFQLVASSAFSGQAALGGFAGATARGAMQAGVARALFSNEAGLGSAPIVHATAVTDHPVRQATYGIFGVFVDTLLVCTLTAGTVLATGAWSSGLTGAELTARAFSLGLPGDWGGHFITLALAPFGFSTTIGWAFYGETGFAYLFGTRSNRPYRLAWVAAVFVGAIGGLEPIWRISDTLNALMAVPNLIAILGALGFLRQRMREFFAEHG